MLDSPRDDGNIHPIARTGKSGESRMSDQAQQQPTPGTDITLLGDEHVRVYRETNGETGYLWNGVPTLLLTMTGRVSKQKRTIPIIFTPYRDSYVIIASKGGSPVHPVWYLNLVADPNAEVQVKGDIIPVVARTAQSPEREAIWAECVKNWPNYNVYQSRTERLIPVVVLDPVKT
jgi:deazaflavin-dependent oxidoreductase (nitroreductase family)